MKSSQLATEQAKRAFYAEFNRALMTELGLAGHFDALHPALLATFGSRRNWQALPGVREAVARAATRKPCFVLTN